MVNAALIAEAKKKWEREQLVQAAQQKWITENVPIVPEELGIPAQIETGARSLLEGATIGISEPILSGINAVLQAAQAKAFEAPELGEAQIPFTDLVSEEYQRDVERRRALESQLPGLATVSEIAGAIAPSPINIGAQLGKIGGAIGKGAIEAIPSIKTLGPMGRIATGAGEAMGIAGTQEATKQLIERPSGFIQGQEGQGILEAATTGALLGGGIKAIPEIGKGAKWIGSKVLSAVGGVSPAVIDKYIQNIEKVRSAKSLEDLKAIVDGALGKVKEEGVSAKANLTDDIQGVIDGLKQRTIQGSQEAYAILERTPGVVHIKGIEGVINGQLKSLKIGGKLPIGDSAQNAYKKLDALKDSIKALGSEISYADTKQIIQQLDDSLEYASRAGEFGSLGMNALKVVRKSFDTILKDIPEYAEKMKDVAASTQLLSEASKKLGDQGTLLAKIPGLATSKDVMGRQLIANLDEMMQSGLGSKLDEISKMSPVLRLETSGTQGLIKSVINNNSIENKKTLQLLSDLAKQSPDQDLVKMAEMTGLADAFTKQFNAGSTNVNLWAVLGGAGLGGLTGGLAGPAGAGAGAVLGSMVRVYGPTVTRKILDGVSYIKGMPTIKKIDSAMSAIPESARTKLKQDFIRAMTIYGDRGPVMIPPANRAQVVQDVSNSNLTPIEKAKAIQSINVDGKIDSGIMNSIALDGAQEMSDEIPDNVNENADILKMILNKGA